MPPETQRSVQTAWRGKDRSPNARIKDKGTRGHPASRGHEVGGPDAGTG